MQQLEVVILAAGMGTRMGNGIPKPLQPFAGSTLLEHVYTTATQLPNARISIVYSPKIPEVKEAMPHLTADWLPQAKPAGTGDALKAAVSAIANDGERHQHTVLSLFCDMPAVPLELLQDFVIGRPNDAVGIVTAQFDQPFGYGRILRCPENTVQHIVEEKDASPEQKAIQEVYIGLMLGQAGALLKALNQIDNDNQQNEYYMTDVIGIAAASGQSIFTFESHYGDLIRGVNTQEELQALEALLSNQYGRRYG